MVLFLRNGDGAGTVMLRMFMIIEGVEASAKHPPSKKFWHALSSHCNDSSQYLHEMNVHHRFLVIV